MCEKPTTTSSLAFGQIIRLIYPKAIKTLFVIICSIIVKENVNLNKLKNQVGVIPDKNDGN